MSRPLRVGFPGALLHVTSRGNGTRAIFSDDHDRRRFLDRLEQACDRFQWILSAYVLLRDEYQIVIELTANNLSRGIKWLNGCYAQWFNRVHDRVGYLFHHRFIARLVEKDTYLLRVIRDVVTAPTRHQLTASIVDYEWSSHRATMGLVEAPPWLAVEPVLMRFASEAGSMQSAYARYIEEPCARVWVDLVGDQYLGSASWVRRMRAELEQTMRSNDHPRAQRDIGRPGISDVISVVARVTRASEEAILFGHGGTARLVTAWLGCHEARLSNTTIAAALRLRSVTQVTNLLNLCERDLRSSPMLRSCIDACLTTLGRKDWKSKI